MKSGSRVAVAAVFMPGEGRPVVFPAAECLAAPHSCGQLPAGGVWLGMLRRLLSTTPIRFCVLKWGILEVNGWFPWLKLCHHATAGLSTYF